MSVPGAELSGGWRRADGSAEGDAPWAVTAYVRGDGPRARKYAGWSLPPPGEEKGYALVFDFTADTKLHGEKWTCVFTGGHVKPKNVDAWLNGVYRADPAGSMKLRDERNRLLVRLTEIDADMLRTVLDIRSAKDASPVSFMKIGL